MALQTFNPDPAPSPGTSFTPKIKVRAAEFGDGYSQIMPDGINNIREQLDLSWDALTEAQRDTIIAFFNAHKGSTPFWYQPVGQSAPMKWTCAEWSSTIPDGTWQVKAKLVQSFSAET